MRNIDIACQLKLLKEAEEALPAAFPGSGPSESWDLIDAVEFGIPETERLHEPAGCFTRHYGNPQTDYAGPPNVTPGAGFTHWRDFATYAGVRLSVPEVFSGTPLTVRLALATYRVGGPPPLEPLIAGLGVEPNTVRLGTIDVPDDGRWHLRDVSVKPSDFGGANPAAFDFVLDDRENVRADEHHWGRRLAFLRLLAPARGEG